MLERDVELEMFKRRINLTEYAAFCGYLLNRTKTSRLSAFMQHPDTGHKVVIARDGDEHWIYFSIHDDNKDHGTIVDFVQKRQGIDLGQLRKELRPWIGDHQMNVPIERFVKDLALSSKDIPKVRAEFEVMAPIDGRHYYLESKRKIPRDVLANLRFAGRIFIDPRQNAVFPHWNKDGLCGFERKNTNFTGFAVNGEKGLWVSRTFPSDTVCVFAESAIDALSHFSLKRPPHARYFSVGGEISHSVQPELIRAAIERMPEHTTFLNITDNDEGGDALTERLKAIFAEIPGRERVLIDDRPPIRGKDWNDLQREAWAKARPVSQLAL